MLGYITLVLGLLGLVLAWVALKRQAELKERIEQVNSKVYHLRRETQEAQEKMQQDMMLLKVQLLQLQGNLQVTPDMKIGEITALHPQAAQLLAGFHLGGCSSCAVDPRQSLAEAAALNSRDVAPILVALNTLVSENGNGPAAPPAERLKTPNIQLYL